MSKSTYKPISRSQEEWISRAIKYDQDTGEFFWKARIGGSSLTGKKTGSIGSHGYLVVNVGGRPYFAHRVAWFLVHGEWPKDELDHINGNKTDNRICNLREASRYHNNMNQRVRRDNTSGVKGVSWHKLSGKWYASISAFGKRHHLGYFHNKETAEKMVNEKRNALHGQFAKN